MNLREDVLNAVPPPAREGVLKMALDHNIVDPNDPTWGMVALAWSATTAAAAGRETLDTALATAARIPETIYTSTIKAGADLSATVAQGIENKTAEARAALVQVIGVAASKGAQDLQKAAAGLTGSEPRKARRLWKPGNVTWRARSPVRPRLRSRGDSGGGMGSWPGRCSS